MAFFVAVVKYIYSQKSSWRQFSIEQTWRQHGCTISERLQKVNSKLFTARHLIVTVLWTKNGNFATKVSLVFLNSQPFIFGTFIPIDDLNKVHQVWFESPNLYCHTHSIDTMCGELSVYHTIDYFKKLMSARIKNSRQTLNFDRRENKNWFC